MVRVCLSASACLGGIRECMIKSERETGNDARLQKKRQTAAGAYFHCARH